MRFFIRSVDCMVLSVSFHSLLFFPYSISVLSFVLPYLPMHSKRQLTKTTTKSSKRNKINKAATAAATAPASKERKRARRCNARRHFCISIRWAERTCECRAHRLATVNRPSMTKHLNYPACVVHTCSCDALCNGFELFNSLVWCVFSLFLSLTPYVHSLSFNFDSNVFFFCLHQKQYSESWEEKTQRV